MGDRGRCDQFIDGAGDQPRSPVLLGDRGPSLSDRQINGKNSPAIIGDKQLDAGVQALAPFAGRQPQDTTLELADGENADV